MNTYARWLADPAAVEVENRAELARLVARWGHAEGHARYLKWATGSRGILV